MSDVNPNPIRPKRLWGRLSYNDTWLCDIAILEDGTLYNPNGYPETDVREAIEQAEARLKARQTRSALQAAATRKERKEKRVYAVARKIIDGEVFGPSQQCAICRKVLTDAESIKRGIGTDCWQGVLTYISEHQSKLIAGK